MDTLQCAVLLAKLERFEWEIIQRQATGETYNREVDQLGIDRVRQKADRTSTFAQYTLKTQQRERVMERLNSAGVPTAIHYPLPLNEQQAYKSLCCPDCTPVSSKMAKNVLSIPISPYLTPLDRMTIIEHLAPIKI